MKFLCAILLLLSAKCFAQYPFEKYPSVKFKKVTINGSLTTDSCGRVVFYKNYMIRFLCRRTRDSSNIILSYRNKIIKRIKAPFDFSPIMVVDPLFVGDIDGNGLPDFKIQLANDGSGLASSLRHKIYLFNEGHNRFKSIYFCDFSVNDEREFNSGGNYEIIGQAYILYRQHSYMLFDLYDFCNGKLANVSSKYGYPIAVPILYKATFRQRKIPEKELRRLSLKLPNYYMAK